MAMWIVTVALLALASGVSVWFLPAFLVVRLAAAIDGFRLVRAAQRSQTRLQWDVALIAIGATVAIQISLRLFAVEAYKFPTSSMLPTLDVGDHIMAERLSLHWRTPGRGEVIAFRHPCEPDREYLKRVIALAGETVEIRCNRVHVGGVALASRLVQGEGCRYDDFDEGGGEWYTKACSEYAETSGDRTYRVYHDADRPMRDEHAGARSRGDSKDFPWLERDRVAPSCVSQYSDWPEREAPVTNQAPGSLVETRAAGSDPCEPQLHYVVPPGHVFVLGDNRANSNDSRYWGAVPVENIEGRVTGIWWGGGRELNVQRFGGID